MRFTLIIDLGNDAMQTPADVAKALRDAAAHLDVCTNVEPPIARDMRDANGNKVGFWSFDES